MNEVCSICKLKKDRIEINCEFCTFQICESCEIYCYDVSCFVRYYRHCRRRMCIYCLVYHNRSRDFVSEIETKNDT